MTTRTDASPLTTKGEPSSLSVPASVAAHTAGPWFVMERGFSRSGPWSAPTVYAADDELRYVAVCACADFANVHSATDNLANARLIAAAPEMYQWLTAHYAVEEGPGRTDRPQYEKLRGILASVRGPEGRAEATQPAGRNGDHSPTPDATGGSRKQS